MLSWLMKKLMGPQVPPDEMIRWIFQAYGWILEHRGGFECFLRERNLVLPKNANFPIRATERHAIAEELFGHVKRHARMEEWQCRLEALDNAHERKLHETTETEEKWSTSAAGTFAMDWDQSDPVISYAPDLVEKQAELVAVFAHELSHYFLATIPFEAPAGPDAEEPATDLCAVYLGFGIFLCNSARRYGAGGMVVAKKGYLSDRTLSFALAVFLELQSIPVSTVTPHLTTNPRSYVKWAVEDIRERWGMEMRGLRKVRGS